MGGKSNTKTKRPSADVAAPLSVSLNYNSPTPQGQTGTGCAAQRPVNLGIGTTKTSGEDFDSFIERLDLQEWLERVEKELKQIKAKLKG
jgi:hypothetical protein